MAELSDSSSSMLRFSVLAGSKTGPRLGHLTLPSRNPISTPHYIANTSRGIVPHIAQDTFRAHTAIQGVYTALEDFTEKAPQKTPPLYHPSNLSSPSPLRSFTALPSPSLLVLSLRRIAPIPSPNPNTNTHVAISTSVGFRSHSIADYTHAATALHPDIVLAPPDIPHGNDAPSQKRRLKMVDRTGDWLASLVAARPRAALFAPVLPLPLPQQQWYLERLEELRHGVQGLSVHDAGLVADLPAALSGLPRLSVAAPGCPAAVLAELSRGVDVCVLPFVGAVTDAGIALGFAFPPPLLPRPPQTGAGHVEARRALGVDMWVEAHALSLEPLCAACTCYACSRHHRAYVQHLLSAKEMLAWVLLAIHNHAVIDAFFAGVRESISKGTFEEDRAAFESYYEAELPQGSGKGPRVRGYQFAADGPGQGRRNEKGFKVLVDKEKMRDEGREKVAEGIVPGADTNAADLEGVGFAAATDAK